MADWIDAGLLMPGARAADDIPDNHVVTIREREISIDSPQLIQNNIRTDTLTLDLDGEWDGLSVLVNIGPDDDITQLMWDGQPLVIPSKVSREVSDVPLSVAGYSIDGQMRLVTKAAPGTFRVVESGYVDRADPGDDPGSLLGQMIAAAQNANESAAAADTSASRAETEAQNAHSAAQTANTATANANLAAENADESAANADAKADKAQQAYDQLSPIIAEIGNVANQPVAELGPAEMLSADDAYAAKPLELKVYGETRQNFWVNYDGTNAGITVKTGSDGALKISGTATSNMLLNVNFYSLKPNEQYTASVDKKIGDESSVYFNVKLMNNDDTYSDNMFGYGTDLSTTFTTGGNISYAQCMIRILNGMTFNTSFRVMLNEGPTAEPWCPPGLNSVDELSIVIGDGSSETRTEVPLDGNTIASLPDGTRDELTVDASGNVTLVKHTASVVVDGDSKKLNQAYDSSRYGTGQILNPRSISPLNMFCDDFPVRNVVNAGTGYAVSSANAAIQSNLLATFCFYDSNWSDLDAANDLLAAQKPTIIYEAEPRTISLGTIDLPALPQGEFHVWAEANVPAQMGMRYVQDLDILLDALTDPKPEGRSLEEVFASEIGSQGFWPWFQARAKAGDFSGMRIGDWKDVEVAEGANVPSQTVRYRIAAFDPYYDCGDIAKGHHIAMVPLKPVTVSGDKASNTSYLQWRSTSDNNGTADEKHPYLVSKLHDWELNDYLPALPQEVQDAIMIQRVFLEERYSSSGKLDESNGWSWADLGKIWSPSEMEVYGCPVWGTKGYSVGFDSQFPIFSSTANRISDTRVNFWLRSVMGGSSSYACRVGDIGVAFYYVTTADYVKPFPCFLVG